MIDAIRVLYTNTSSSVLTPDGETDPFDITAGILQGDTLAPFLFILVVDYILRLSVDTISEQGPEEVAVILLFMSPMQILPMT